MDFGRELSTVATLVEPVEVSPAQTEPPRSMCANDTSPGTNSPKRSAAVMVSHIRRREPHLATVALTPTGAATSNLSRASAELRLVKFCLEPVE